MPKTCNTTELRHHASWFGEDDEWYAIDDKGNHYAIVRLLGMKDGKPRMAIQRVGMEVAYELAEQKRGSDHAREHDAGDPPVPA